MAQTQLPPAVAVPLGSLAEPGPGGRAARLLAKASGGAVTLLSFAEGGGLPAHTAATDALVFVLEGRLTLEIDGAPVEAGVGSVVRIPATAPHAVTAPVAARMLLVTLRDA